MGRFLFELMQSFVATFVSATAKALAKRLFSKKDKENPTLTPTKRNKGGTS